MHAVSEAPARDFLYSELMNPPLPDELPRCLVLTAGAQAFAEEIARFSDTPIPVTACATAEEALAARTDEKILFGDPEMIASILPRMPGIEWVQSSWAGVTPLVDLGRRDYLLTGVKDVFGPQMSEYVLGYLLARELRIVERRERQQAREWYETFSGTLQGKRLGVMGTGSIGSDIAKTAQCFGLEVTGLSRSGTAVEPFDAVLPVGRLHEFLESLDYLVSVLPKTPETNRLLNAESLAKLPRHAYFINVGRGNVIDEAALIEALSEGRLGGATLDVFDEEPVPADSPLWDTPNLSITAHVAAVSHPRLIAPIFVANYRRYVNRQPMQGLVDFEAGY